MSSHFMLNEEEEEDEEAEEENYIEDESEDLAEISLYPHFSLESTMTYKLELENLEFLIMGCIAATDIFYESIELYNSFLFTVYFIF